MGKKIPDLRSDGDDARLQITKERELAAVGCELLVVVPDKPDVEFLRQKFRPSRCGKSIPFWYSVHVFFKL